MSAPQIHWAISPILTIHKLITFQANITAVSPPARVVRELEDLWGTAAQLLQQPVYRLAGVHTLLQGTGEVVDLGKPITGWSMGNLW